MGTLACTLSLFAAKTICSVENTNEMHRNEEIHA